MEIEGHCLKISGPLGKLEREVDPKIKVEVVDNQILVKRQKEDRLSRSLHGLTRSLIANMVTGVFKGWQKKLELVGVGYRAQTTGDKIILNVNYSHPIEITVPENIKFEVEDNTKITVSGVDKNLVGQIAATIHKVRPPEPYKGKGIRYLGEYVRRKTGKVGKIGTGAK